MAKEKEEDSQNRYEQIKNFIAQNIIKSKKEHLAFYNSIKALNRQILGYILTVLANDAKKMI